jgi:hypothetical protein
MRHSYFCKRCDKEHRSRADLQNGFCRGCIWHVPAKALLNRRAR